MSAYDVFMKDPTRDIWTVRTNGHRETDLEMCQALTQDLSRLGVAWEIRDGVNKVVAYSVERKEPSSMPEFGPLQNAFLILDRALGHLWRDRGWGLQTRYEAGKEIARLISDGSKN